MFKLCKIYPINCFSLYNFFWLFPPGLNIFINVRICMEHRHLGVIAIFVRQLVE